MSSDLQELLRTAKSSIPKQQQILCDYLCTHMAEASGMSAAELSDKAGVSTSTILRTVKTLGFSSYAELKRTLRKEVFSEASSSLISYSEWENRSTSNSNNAHSSYVSYLNACEKAIRQFHSEELFSQFDAVVNSLIGAKRIFVLGLRSSQPMAKLFELLLIHSSLSIVQLSEDTGFLYDRIATMTTQDVLFCIAYRPVTKQSIDVLDICSSEHIPIILLTNDTSYFSKYNTLSLSIPISALSPSAVTTAVTINIITSEIEKRLSMQRKMQIQRIEQLIDKNNIEIWKSTQD